MRDLPPQTDSAPCTTACAADETGPLFRFDPGWLFIVAGVAIVAASVLIPARQDVVRAQWQRDRAIASERFHAERLGNYSTYLDAVHRHDPTVVVSLAATQLNLIPAGKQVMLSPGDLSLPPADVFAQLEPTFTDVPAPTPPRSLLQKWSTDPRTAPWLMAVGGLFVLIGLLPMSKR